MGDDPMESVSVTQITYLARPKEEDCQSRKVNLCQISAQETSERISTSLVYHDQANLTQSKLLLIIVIHFTQYKKMSLYVVTLINAR